MRKSNKVKINNEGFTLLEVLIAMIILAVISIPLLRAFATAARTNQKAKIEMKCANAAENLAEDFRDVKVEDLIEKYSASSENEILVQEDIDVTDIYNSSITYEHQNKYTFTIKNQDDMSSSLPDGYYAKVILDSAYYPNANGLNLSQISPVSIKDSAIYTMESNFDNDAYLDYLEKNKKASAEKPGDYSVINLDDASAISYLKENLTRTIRIVIDSVGTEEIEDPDVVKVSTGGDGPNVTPEAPVMKEINLVKVTMSISYHAKGEWAKKYFYPEDRVEKEFLSKPLFDNDTSHNELSSIYLFFYPRYLAASHGNDEIIIENVENVKTNLYLSALMGAADEFNRPMYISAKHQKVTVIEDASDSQEKAMITLRTNLVKNVPYSQASSSDGEIMMGLTYKNFAGTDTKTGSAAQNYLSAANIDGKTLSRIDTPKRIYKMTVEIYDDTPEDVVTDPSVTPAVKKSVLKFDGTKLEY